MTRMPESHPYCLPRVPRLPLLGAVVLLASGGGQEDFARAADLAEQAAAFTTVPGTTRPQGTIKVAAGVLDTFIERAPKM